MFATTALKPIDRGEKMNEKVIVSYVEIQYNTSKKDFKKSSPCLQNYLKYLEKTYLGLCD